MGIDLLFQRPDTNFQQRPVDHEILMEHYLILATIVFYVSISLAAGRGVRSKMKKVLMVIDILGYRDDPFRKVTAALEVLFILFLLIIHEVLQDFLELLLANALRGIVQIAVDPGEVQ